MAGLGLSTMAAERTIKINSKYLNIPVSHADGRVRINFIDDVNGTMPINVRLAQGEPEYWVFLDVSRLKGKKLRIEYPDDLKGVDRIFQADTIVGESGIYSEANRPQFHFTTRRGWINDPNGLIFLDGEYHLFYQHNPYERDWENMHWGHAVSTDLVHWTELPTALHPDMTGTMFSGSAAIDYDNDSGFGTKDKPAMVVAYTTAAPDRQMQCIAYSTDNGRTFTKYGKNPVIDSKEVWNSGDTRDPKIFKYDDHWVLVLNERDGHSIYTSPNLRDWTYSSHTTGFWECPELFPLPVDGNPDNILWVMYGASGNYMLGDFDGYKFTPRSGKHRYSGGTIYAAQTFANIPAEDGRRIQIGWGRQGHRGMNVNGQMLIPTELTLASDKEGPRLINRPVREIDAICVPAGKWSGLTQGQAEDKMKEYANSDQGLRIRTTLRLSHATDAGIALAGQRLVEYDMNSNSLNGFFYSPLDPTSMELMADIFIDRTSVEVFIDGGRYSYSMERHLPDGQREPFRFYGNNVTVKDLEVFTIPSIWN